MIKEKVWFIEVPDDEERYYLAEILEFLLPEFIRIFGADVMLAEKCIVFNNPQASCPMLIINTDPVRIRLNQTKLNFWAQMIYQLSHELCHYAIRQNKIIKDYTLKWFEEILCEAISLYALAYSANNWRRCKLKNNNANFFKDISDYLKNELQKKGTHGLKKCLSQELLHKHEQICCEDRSKHLDERNALYSELLQQPLDAKCFIDYPKYVMGERALYIDFNKWKSDDSNRIIDILESFQPC